MKIDWKFVFKKSFSIVLKGLLIVTGLYLVSVTILSLVYRPMGVKVTNVTSSSATVSWYTDVPMTGEVSYKEKDTFLPLFLSGIGADKAYDDRDFAYAQKLCVAEFNMKLEKEVDEDFTVSGEDYNCDNVKVSKLGRYYVHHVTIKNLDEKKDYYFRVGNRVWGWKGDVVSFKTFETPENVKEPVPVFGRIVSSEGNYSGDSIVYGRFKDVSTGNESVMYSSVTNDDGGWYLDGGNLRGVDGEIVELSSGDDTFSVTGMYKNSKMSAPTTWVFGYFDGAYPDLKVAYSEKDNFLYKLVFGVNACNVATLVGCDADEIKELAPTVGYGNAAKALAAKNDNVLDKDVLKELGLCDNSVACAGNMSAIMGAGNGITESAWNATEGAGYAVELKKNDPDNEEERGYWDTNTIAPASSSGGGNNGGGSPTANPEAASGEVTVTVKKNNLGNDEVEVKIGDVDIVDWNFMKDKIDELKESCPRSANAEPCEFIVKAVEIDILQMIADNENFIADCRADSSCPKDALVEAMKQKKENVEEVKKIEDAFASAALPDLYEPCIDLKKCPITLPQGFSLEDVSNLNAGNLTPDYLNEFLKFVAANPTDQNKDSLLLLFEQIGIKADLKTLSSYLVPGNQFQATPSGQIKLIAPQGPQPEIIANVPSSSVVIPTYIANAVEDTYIIDEKVGESALVEDVSDNLLDLVLDKNPNRKSDQIKYLILGSECSDGKCNNEEAKRLMDNLLANGVDVDGIYLVGGEFDFQPANFVVPSIPQGPLPDPKVLEDMINQFDIPPIQPMNKFEAAVETLSSLYQSFIGKAYAATDTVKDGYVLFLPEYGMFSIQLGNFDLTTEVSKDRTIYVFYMESNGIDGFQAPIDPENPTPKEDIVIKSNSFKVKISQKATSRKYDLNEGVNIVSFDFIPASKKGNIYSAQDLVTDSKSGGVNIEYISYFDGGRWVEGMKCTKESCVGSDFTILPGKGYLVKVSKAGKMSVPAYDIESAIPINLSAGWNLIGVHGYSSAYTAKSLINSINKVEGLTADNVSWYPTSKGRYEGLQVTEGVEYGFDFPINPMNGYFVRIKKFTPKDEACKSIIWHDGNDLNGTCGDSKSIF